MVPGESDTTPVKAVLNGEDSCPEQLERPTFTKVTCRCSTMKNRAERPAQGATRKNAHDCGKVQWLALPKAGAAR